MPTRVMSPWSQVSYRSQVRPSSRCSLVESNIRNSSSNRSSTPIIPEVHIKPRARPREISINDAPMMLLPRARVRDTMDYFQNERAKTCSIIADTSTQGLHISTIQTVNSANLRPAPTKSSLKSRRNSITRSEADSGISSLKRAVTFDNLSQSQSTVFNIDDDLDSLSDHSPDDHLDYDDDFAFSNNINVEFPDHLDTFGGDEPVVLTRKSERSRSKSRNSSASSKRQMTAGSDVTGTHTCGVCGMVLNDSERVQRSFGRREDTLMDWVMGKWTKQRRELQYIPRTSYVYRGHVPHFCNFVQPLSLHTKSSGQPGDGSLAGATNEDDDEEDEELKYITETTDGRLINKWRKDSQSSSNDRDRTPVPPLDDYLEEPVKINIDIQNWMSGKKTSKGLLHHQSFSSIPEMKEDGVNSGTEGRPGSPSSQDGTDVQADSIGPGIGVDVVSNMPPVPEEAQTHDRRLSSSGNSEVKTPSGADSLLILANVDRDDDKSSSNQSNGRAPSPFEPPPSPVPVKLPSTKPAEPTSSGRKRNCVKKGKKPLERTRRLKEIEPPPPEPVAKDMEQMDPLANTSLESEKVEPKVELQVPDLPSTLEEKKSKKKEKSKLKKHLIEAQDDLNKPDPTELVNDQLRQGRVEIDFSNMDQNGMDEVKRPPQIKSWIQGRLALSQQSSRFELPMDMKELETMTPEQYIRKHCIITSRRQNLYAKIFLKNKDKSQAILYKDLDRTLKDVLVHTITSEQVQGVLDTFNITENTKVDFKYFAGMAAFAERILYPRYVTEDTVDMPEYQREKIESADFCALDWKFHGVNINKAMLHLLNQLR